MLYSVCCSARRRKERLPLSATSSSSQPTTHLPPAPPFSVSGVCHACPERLGDLVGALDPIFLSPVRPPHYPPKPFRMRRPRNLSSRLPLTSLQSISISARVAPKSFRMRSSTHFSPNSFRMRSSKKSGGRGLRVNWAAGKHTQTERYREEKPNCQ